MPAFEVTKHELSNWKSTVVRRLQLPLVTGKAILAYLAAAVLLIPSAAPAENLFGVSAIPLAALEGMPQPSASGVPQTPAQGQSPSLDVLRQQGVEAFQKGDNAEALRIFRQVIAADPTDIVAYNIAGNCSIRLGDYPSAIDFFKHALQLRPDEYHNVGALMRAYTLAGMSPERDALRKHITELEHENKLPPTFNYVFDTFQAGDKKVEVAEFPQIQGFYGERYRFKVFTSAGKMVYCVTLESDSLEQSRWAKEHPKESAAGKRQFSMDGYSTDSHSTYAFYDGEPPYDEVREQVKQVLAGTKQPISKLNYASPQPIPGAE